jgi:hypothetical protein
MPATKNEPIASKVCLIGLISVPGGKTREASEHGPEKETAQFALAARFLCPVGVV